MSMMVGLMSAAYVLKNGNVPPDAQIKSFFDAAEATLKEMLMREPKWHQMERDSDNRKAEEARRG